MIDDNVTLKEKSRSFVKKMNLLVWLRGKRRNVATPLWGKCEDEIHTPKSGTWSPPGLPKTQSLIAGVKTPRIEVCFISLKRSWSVDVLNSSHEPFGHLQHKLWSKKGPGVKLPVWLPTTKSRVSTQSRCAQVECDTSLERSWGELQVFFRPHLNRRSELGVMSSQESKPG
jgi:hypothetical protein